MKKMNFEQMEIINGGQTVVSVDNSSVGNIDDYKMNLELGCNVVVGLVGVVAAGVLGVTTMGLGLVASYATTMWAYYGCKLATGNYK